MQIQKVRQGYKLVENFFHRLIEIPADWDYPKFSEIVKVNPLTKIDEKLIPYLPMDAVDVEKPNFNYFEERNLSDFPSLPKFQENDVLFASITPSTENGKTCIIENFSRKGIGSSELTVLRPTEKIIPKYLYYYVKSHRIRQFAISQMMGTTGRQRVPDYVFKKDLSFELPSKSEQQKIASILSNIDSLISQTQKEIEHTQRLKKGLMQKLLTRGIGHTKFKKIKTLYGKYEEIPEDWEYRKLSDLAKVKGGKRLPKGEPFSLIKTEHPYLRVTDFRNYGINESNLKYISSKIFQKIKNYTISSDDVYISIAGTIGLAGLIPESLDGANLTENAAKITNLQEIKKEYLSILLNSELIQNQIKSYLGKTSQPKLALFRIEKLELPLPAIQEQQKIASILSNIDSQIQKQQEHKSKLESLKKGLMQKLLTGQIRVKV